MNANIEYMRTIPLVQAFYWAVENTNPVEHTEEFFYLRERYRKEEQLEAVLADGRHKGWELAKSLQTQLNIATEALTNIARYELRGVISNTAKDALRKLEEHKES